MEICPEMHTTKMAKFHQQFGKEKAGEFGESGESGKFVQIADNLQANANEKTRGAPWKAGEFGESGESGKFVKIADNL